MRISHLIPWSQRQLGSCLRRRIILLSFSSGKQMQRPRIKQWINYTFSVWVLISLKLSQTEWYGNISYLFLINGGQTLKSQRLWKEAVPGSGCLDFFAQDTARDRYGHPAVSRHLLCSCEVPSPSWSGFEFSRWLSLNESDSLYSSHGFYILYAKSC